MRDDAKTSAPQSNRQLVTPDDYEDALAEMEPYLVKPPAQGTPAGILFYALVKRIAAYETKHFPFKDDPRTGNVH